MARRRFECWNCHKRFDGHDNLPMQYDHTCPRCGCGVRKWIPTTEDRKRGTRYKDFASGLRVRLGREGWNLFFNGRYIVDPKTNEARKIDAGKPNFTN